MKIARKEYKEATYKMVMYKPAENQRNVYSKAAQPSKVGEVVMPPGPLTNYVPLSRGCRPGLATFFALRTGFSQNYFADRLSIKESLTHANLLQLASHHDTDSVSDLELLCRSKTLRPIGIMVVNSTRSVFLMSVVLDTP